MMALCTSLLNSVHGQAYHAPNRVTSARAHTQSSRERVSNDKLALINRRLCPGSVGVSANNGSASSFKKPSSKRSSSSDDWPVMGASSTTGFGAATDAGSASSGSSASTAPRSPKAPSNWRRSEEHTSELQSRGHLVCRLLLEKKKEDEEA